jgi:hypothetical protein
LKEEVVRRCADEFVPLCAKARTALTLPRVERCHAACRSMMLVFLMDWLAAL